MTNDQQEQIKRLWELQRITQKIVQDHADRMGQIATANVVLSQAGWDALIRSWEQANKTMQDIGKALCKSYGIDVEDKRPE